MTQNINIENELMNIDVNKTSFCKLNKISRIINNLIIEKRKELNIIDYRKEYFNIIISVVTNNLAVSEVLIFSKSRKKNISTARHIIYYFIIKNYKNNKKFKKISMQEIANIFNDSHSMVIYSAKKIKQQQEIYKKFNKFIEKMQKEIEERVNYL